MQVYRPIKVLDPRAVRPGDTGRSRADPSEILWRAPVRFGLTSGTMRPRQKAESSPDGSGLPGNKYC